MRTRAIRAWAVAAALGAVFLAVLAPSALTEALAWGAGALALGVLTARDGLRERGSYRRRR
jgi:hypothetical protein